MHQQQLLKLIVLLSVGLTQNARMDDEACTAASSFTLRVTIDVSGGRWPCNGNPMGQRGSSGVMLIPGK